jgi:protein TonB
MPSEARPPAAQAAAGGGRPSAARVATWKSDLALRLARAKRYPAEAQARRAEGVATIRFSLDGSGRVVAKALVRGSGISALDDESLALIHRAAPYPPPPPGVAVPIEITVPVRFSFR